VDVSSIRNRFRNIERSRNCLTSYSFRHFQTKSKRLCSNKLTSKSVIELLNDTEDGIRFLTSLNNYLFVEKNKNNTNKYR
jgi:hypothetical protein